MGRAQNQTLFDAWARFSYSRYAVPLVFVWAFAEAIIWPVVPDFVLILMIAGAPRRLWPLLAGAILGSSLGGVLIYLFAYLDPARAQALAPLLPLAKDSKIQQASVALAEQGVFAFLIQPISGISYRFYALVAGAYGFNPLLVMIISTGARGFRMLLTSAALALFARRFTSFVRDYWFPLLLIYFVVFGYIWVVTQIVR